MKPVIKMNEHGELVFPKSIREALRISGTAKFKASVRGNNIELTLMPDREGPVIKMRRGLYVVSTKSKKFNAANAINIVRQRRLLNED
jgi:bifunctional DNA-binding transcriptional regulator/antitoxin component of YhaV-PrlF toxin-antitoxin module